MPLLILSFPLLFFRSIFFLLLKTRKKDEKNSSTLINPSPPTPRLHCVAALCLACVTLVRSQRSDKKD
ncbi:hypothetical protein LINPERHAP1_LOCUS31640 [Linum perenne]